MSSRGLPDYLKQKGESMRAAAQRRPSENDWSESVGATCVADDVTGVRKLSAGKWQLIGDSGPDFGGWGLGPSSPELLCGVISTCLTHTYLIAAAWNGVPMERVEVNVTSDNNDAHLLDIPQDDPKLPFNLNAKVTVEAPEATPGQLAELHAYAEQTCPLSNLIRNPNQLTVEIAD
jgi:organic hydroperoxide reductase OsmC/OhrA